MSDNDLIRRGDALGAAWEADSLELSAHGAGKIEARINAIPAAQPTVKPLVWDTDGCAEVFGLRYLLCDPESADEAYGWYVLEETTNTVIEADGSEDAAKAAAQADYDARILSALDMQPTVSPDVAALVEAAAEALSEIEAGDVSLVVIRDLRAALARVKGETK